MSRPALKIEGFNMAVIQFPSGDVRQGSLIELDGQRVWFPRPILITGRMEDGTEHAEVSFSSKPVLVALAEAESSAFESWPECLPRDVHRPRSGRAGVSRRRPWNALLGRETRDSYAQPLTQIAARRSPRTLNRSLVECD